MPESSTPQARPGAPPQTPTDGMVITRDTVFAPGVYVLPRGISIAADHVTLDGNGALLVGRERSGAGLSILGRRHVTVRNLRLQEYYHGIYAHRCSALTIAGCRITGTAELPPNQTFLDIWLPAEKAYGGGIFLWEVEDSQIAGNDLQHQMNGLLSYRCRRLSANENIANYCSGSGFYLSNTCDSLFEGNWADFCCRYEQRGERAGHMGADAAGFVAVRGACRNVFRRNRARMSGDGFFLAGLSSDLVLDGCDDNLFEFNDGGYSPNIAFEATFCRGNVFRDNLASACNYGFWLGFSCASLVEQNQVNANRQAGVAVENGCNIRVRGNTFRSNGHGILLWSKQVPEFVEAVPENATSSNWLIEENEFQSNAKAIRIAADQDHGIRPMPPDRPGAPRPHHHTICRNDILDNRVGIELVGAEETTIEDNRMEGNMEGNVASI